MVFMRTSKTKAHTPQEAARRLAQAQRMVHEARRSLATARRHAKAPAHIFTGAWKLANSALERNRQQLRQAHGVVGSGIGFRVKDGIETDEPCVVVFVRNKKSPRLLEKKGYTPIPKQLSHGKTTVATDVMRLGRSVPHPGPGSIGPANGRAFGTIGVLGVDDATGAPVAVTAMHVSGLASFGPTTVASGIPFAMPDTATENGRLVLGTTTDIDAAKVVLEDPGSILPPLPVAGVRQVSNDVNSIVHLFGAVSGSQSGVVKYVNVDVADRGLVQALLVDIQTANGDSGSGLLDESNFLLGFLFGLAPADIADGLRIFCPADLVMRTLGCSI